VNEIPNLPLRKILGIDILPGNSPQKGKNTRYAYALLIDGKIRKRGEGVSFKDLADIVTSYKVDAIALDNIYEIGSNSEEIISRLQKMEYIPRIIQVNLIQGKLYKLENLALTLNLEGGKPSPLKSAEICALLAYHGVGSEVLLFENETKIVISKGRNVSQGGMSKERYRRNIELMILRLTKEVKEILDRHRIDYDLYARKAESGLERSAFIVYAPRGRLYGLVKKRKTQDVQVNIQPISKGTVEFIPLGEKSVKRYTPNRYLIMGVDPGISTGVAVLDINRRLLSLITRRWLSRNQLIREVSNLGRVLVVATDVSPPPVYVKKLASSLNAILYVPEHDLTINEKKELVSIFIGEQKYPLKIHDTHQRDALAAALKAYNHYASKMDKVESELKRLELDIPSAEVKALVVRGYSTHDAIRSVSEKYLLPETLPTLTYHKEKKISPDEVTKTVRRLVDELAKLRRMNEKLTYEKKDLELKLLETEEALQKILSIQGIEFRKTKLYESLLKRIEGLEQDKEKLKEDIETLKLNFQRLKDYFKKYIEGELLVVYPLEVFNKKEVTNKKVIVSLENNINVDYLREKLMKTKPKAVIIGSNISQEIRSVIEKAQVPVLLKNKLHLIKIDDYYLVDRDQFEVEYRKAYEKIVSEEEELESKIRKILDDYRRRRIKELDGARRV